MKQPGQIVLVPFPYADLSAAKLRPVLLLHLVTRRFDDWLVCMVTSQLHHAEPNFDEILSKGDVDFPLSGLKVDSAIRNGRLAVIEGALMAGAIGEIGPERLQRIRQRLADWIAKG